jgi:hypothetical protein
MSWQTYVDEHLMCETEGHHLTCAAIIGHDGTVWAQSAAFPSVSASLSTCSFSICFCVGRRPDQIDRSRTANPRFPILCVIRAARPHPVQA